MSNIPVLKPQEVVRILENLGFLEVRQKVHISSFDYLINWYWLPWNIAKRAIA
ncbi:hypothetical protein Sta7437_1739 [Stanieria cyanosphaera PCC 7437]|uniref:YcfA family protein n=1 Tax=Stanieria cyanosphaera (strain ATCC 29371 / PCC 7437) TaxID=111780 RepID=K9XRZ5_STAC7|nr:hypothetical protein [Stanieria cyanosphaera]AFZ35298.1 hypothetical protein Sta7437_1739 [Stanieria cyanosphaera PCC 7437]